MIPLVAAIHRLKPNAQFTFKGEDYSTVEWIELEGAAPTQAEIDAALAEIKAEEEARIIALENKRQDVMSKLGLTDDDLKALFA
jgi:hypothetical protein